MLHFGKFLQPCLRFPAYGIDGLLVYARAAQQCSAWSCVHIAHSQIIHAEMHIHADFYTAADLLVHIYIYIYIYI